MIVVVAFRSCLLATNTDEHIANVGYIFFNLLRPKCFRFRRRFTIILATLAIVAKSRLRYEGVKDIKNL
jgi:hypothetical protein